MKTMPIKWVVNGFEGAEAGPDVFQEVSKAGTGFLLMKKHVFEKMNAHPAVKPYKNDIGLDPKYDKYLKTYFDTAVRQGRYYSEDWTFCENWRDLGGQIWVDKRILLRHTGTYVFDFATQDKLYQDLQALDLQKQSAQAVTPVAAPQLEEATTVQSTPAPLEPKAKILASSEDTTPVVAQR